MQILSLSAHFDGQQILLDEPYQLPPDAKLLVTVLPSPEVDERGDWFAFAAQSFNAAYGDDEPEYTTADLKELNPDYRGG